MKNNRVDHLHVIARSNESASADLYETLEIAFDEFAQRKSWKRMAVSAR